MLDWSWHFPVPLDRRLIKCSLVWCLRNHAWDACDSAASVVQTHSPKTAPVWSLQGFPQHQPKLYPAVENCVCVRLKPPWCRGALPRCLVPVRGCLLCSPFWTGLKVWCDIWGQPPPTPCVNWTTQDLPDARFRQRFSYWKQSGNMFKITFSALAF